MASCRSCGANIIWAVSGTTGKRMPLDAAPALGQHPFCLLRGLNGDELAISAGWFFAGSAPLLVVQDRLAFYVSHFATCPDADMHRRSAA
jgi:hypothetical protein